MKNVFSIINYDQWEPYMNSQSVKIHYELHHLQYVKNLEKENIDDFNIVMNNPTDYSTQILNNAKQIHNHNLFWQSIKLNTEKIDIPLQEFKQQANSVFGSGWVWIIQKNKEISIMTTYNADCPDKSYNILLCLDLWEHAFYVQYPGKRTEFINIFCEHLINYDFIKQNLIY